MISASKSGYSRAHPDDLPISNANVCTGNARIWFGDLDTHCRRAEARRASPHALDMTVYVMPERAGRFHGRDDNPQLGTAEITVSSVGLVKTVPLIERWQDRRLHLRREARLEK